MVSTDKHIICTTKDFSVSPKGFKTTLLGFGTLSTVLAATFVVSSLYISSESFADTDVKASAKINTTLSLAAPGEIAVEIDPSASGTFASKSNEITVNTNNQTGYTLSLASKTNDTSMTHSSATITDKIVSMDSSYPSASMANNTWGYALGSASESTKFVPIPAASAPINIASTERPSSSSDRTTKINVGVKADTSIASGKYSNTLTFSAVANEVPAFGGITTMQQMTTAICEAEPTPSAADIDVPTATLKDTRDGKSYKVSKLADGHCWMSQNLALGGSSSITLTPADSNVTSNWTLPAADTSWISSNTNPHYRIDSANQTKYGNYYNWTVATAGSGTESVVSADATQSICPKGWRLPKGGKAGDFINLITTTYGVSFDAAGSTKLQSAPLSFPLSGNWDHNGLKNQGSAGFYWSSTAYSDTNNAYDLYFRSSYFFPAYSNERLSGFSVRCLAE